LQVWFWKAFEVKLMSGKATSCPRDQAALVPQTFDSILQVEHCGSCGGVFLDKGALEKLENATAQEYAKESKQPDDMAEEAYEMGMQQEREDAVCPKCDAEMEKSEYGFCSSVLIDSCPKCGGIWLDHGELKQIMLFFERAKLDTSSLHTKVWSYLHNLFGQKQRT
jgi:Zn-finger nucleic acid-binding protein